LLVDCQRDYFALPGLSPSAPVVVASLARLLETFRRRGLPVVHVVTTVHEELDDRLPHWKRNGIRRCVEGTAGHAPPEALRPRKGEETVHKQQYSGFSTAELEERLRDAGVSGVVVAGTMLHACVRQTALDAWARGFEVWLANDAVASDDPVHAAATETWLEARLEFSGLVSEIDERLELDEVENRRQHEEIDRLFDPDDDELTVRELESPVAASATPRSSATPRFAPADRGRALETVPDAGEGDVRRAIDAARKAFGEWRSVSMSERQRVLSAWADAIHGARDALCETIVFEVGKPRRDARSEVERAEALVRAAAAISDEAPKLVEPGVFSRRVSLGAVAVVTPWNNPLAIPAGKLAPALAFGNAVVWKPAVHGFGVARALFELFPSGQVPTGVIGFVSGGERTARALMAADGIDAVTLTGSELTGRMAQRLAARRFLPLQAELGGNNASIVWEPDDEVAALCTVVRGAFGFAGQRCTANRRVVVSEAALSRSVATLEAAMRELALGEPELESTDLGPVISERARARIEGVIGRAQDAGLAITSPARGGAELRRLEAKGSYVAPSLVVAPDTSHEVVTEETFGPVLVVQPAKTFDEALALAGAVRQGLVMSLFARDPKLRSEFLVRAHSGVLKLDAATADASVNAPFGGFGASGVGPPEHGEGDRAFFTRLQTVYASTVLASD
jgi:acyl-CoA reductase-like NAD-dependent aldehyde dehydrogenase/nicotinamidase-related amidase